jgi:type II secretory pathway component PulK
VIDLGGLIPLNSKSVTHTKQLLRFLNVETPLISRLTATSQDFLDKDESVRPNGAEAFEYQQRGMKQPANTELLSRFELRRVLGWDSVENLWSNDALLSAMAANVSSRYNVNAMPPIVAQVVFGLTDAEVEVFLEHRTEKSFTSVRELVDRTGIDFYANFEKIKLTPSRGFRFSFWYPQARLKRELDVHFPSVVSAGDSPWIISRDLVLPITEPNALVEPRKAQTDLFR